MSARLDNCVGHVDVNVSKRETSTASVGEQPIKGTLPSASEIRKYNSLDPSFIKGLEESGPEILLDREKVMIARRVLENIPYGEEIVQNFEYAIKEINDSTFCDSYLGMLKDLKEEEYVRKFCDYAKGLSKEKYEDFVSAVKKCFYNFRDIAIDTDPYFERVFYNIEKSTEHPYALMNDKQICNYLRANVYSILVHHATKGGNDFSSNIRNAIGAMFVIRDLFLDTLQTINEMVLKSHQQIFDEGFFIKTASDKLLGDLYRVVKLYLRGNYKKASFLLEKNILQNAGLNEEDDPIFDYAHFLYLDALGPYAK